MIKIVLTNVFGIQPGYDTLRIAPASQSFLKKATVSLPIRGKLVNLRIEKTGTSSLTFNGKAIEGDTIRYEEMAETNDIYVTC